MKKLATLIIISLLVHPLGWAMAEEPHIRWEKDGKEWCVQECEPEIFLIKVNDWLAYIETESSYSHLPPVRTYHWIGDFAGGDGSKVTGIFDKLLKIEGITSAIPVTAYSAIISIGCLYDWIIVEKAIHDEFSDAKDIWESRDPEKPILEGETEL